MDTWLGIYLGTGLGSISLAIICQHGPVWPVRRLYRIQRSPGRGKLFTMLYPGHEFPLRPRLSWKKR